MWGNFGRIEVHTHRKKENKIFWRLRPLTSFPVTAHQQQCYHSCLFGKDNTGNLGHLYKCFTGAWKFSCRYIKYVFTPFTISRVLRKIIVVKKCAVKYFKDNNPWNVSWEKLYNCQTWSNCSILNTFMYGSIFKKERTWGLKYYRVYRVFQKKVALWFLQFLGFQED